MRKLYPLLFLLFASGGAYSQSPVFKITQSYFRSDPFNTSFSSFVNHLLNDPAFTDKYLKKRTDTSLFYFTGTYSSHNPFFFKPKRVEVSLTESIILRNDSIPPDTIYVYQLMAFNNDTKEGIQELKKEFEKMHKRYKGSFYKNTFIEKSVSGYPGSTYNFFDPLHAVAPFALSWFGPTENKEVCLVLTIRMDIDNNKAILPVPFYRF